MKTVGVRELKNRLSAYLRQVSSGETLLVTDRGRVVAELAPPRPPERQSAAAGIAELARRGLLTPAATDAKPYPRLPRAMKGRRSSELLEQERSPR